MGTSTEGYLVWGVAYESADRGAERVLEATDGEADGVCLWHATPNSGGPVIAFVKASNCWVYSSRGEYRAVTNLGRLEAQVSREWRETLRAFGAKHGLDVSNPQWMLHFSVG
jgi:hypothetical protein